MQWTKWNSMRLIIMQPPLDMYVVEIWENVIVVMYCLPFNFIF